MQVSRMAKTGWTLGFMLALAGSLALCTNFTKRVEFSLSSYSEQTKLSVYVARLGPCFNPHGGCSDGYEFAFPSGLDRVSTDQISHYSVNYKPDSLTLSAGSGIGLKVDSAGCEVSVSLFGADGLALPINGVHRVANCGQQYLDKHRTPLPREFPKHGGEPVAATSLAAVSVTPNPSFKRTRLRRSA